MGQFNLPTPNAHRTFEVGLVVRLKSKRLKSKSPIFSLFLFHSQSILAQCLWIIYFGVFSKRMADSRRLCAMRIKMVNNSNAIKLCKDEQYKGNMHSIRNICIPINMILCVCVCVDIGYNSDVYFITI